MILECLLVDFIFMGHRDGGVHLRPGGRILGLLLVSFSLW